MLLNCSLFDYTNVQSVIYKCTEMLSKCTALGCTYVQTICTKVSTYFQSDVQISVVHTYIHKCTYVEKSFIDNIKNCTYVRHMVWANVQNPIVHLYKQQLYICRKKFYRRCF